MRALVLAAVATAAFALPALAGDAPPDIATIGPYEAFESSATQLVLIDRGSVDWVDGNLRAVILALRQDNGSLSPYLLRIRVDCKTYALAQMEQTMLDAKGNPTHSNMLDNAMKATGDATVGREMATAACDGAPKTDDGQIISFDTLSDALSFGQKYFAAQ